MTTKKRISKHEMKEDQFVTGMFRLEEWAEQNLKLIIGGVAAVVIGGLAIWFFIWQSGKNEDRAFELLSRAEVEMRSNQASLAIADFEEILSKYGSTDAATQAAFRLANLYFENNDFQKAEEAYSRYAKNYAQDEDFRHSALRGVAASLAGQARYQDASKAFLESAQADTTATTFEDDLLDAVDNGIKAGDTALAKEAFALLERKSTTSERYRSAKILLIEKGMLTYEQGEFK